MPNGFLAVVGLGAIRRALSPHLSPNLEQGDCLLVTSEPEYDDEGQLSSHACGYGVHLRCSNMQGITQALVVPIHFIMHTSEIAGF